MNKLTKIFFSDIKTRISYFYKLLPTGHYVIIDNQTVHEYETVLFNPSNCSLSTILIHSTNAINTFLNNQ